MKRKLKELYDRDIYEIYCDKHGRVENFDIKYKDNTSEINNIFNYYKKDYINLYKIYLFKTDFILLELDEKNNVKRKLIHYNI